MRRSGSRVRRDERSDAASGGVCDAMEGGRDIEGGFGDRIISYSSRRLLLAGI